MQAAEFVVAADHLVVDENLREGAHPTASMALLKGGVVVDCDHCVGQVKGAKQAQAEAAWHASFFSGDLFGSSTPVAGSTDHPLFKALRSTFPTSTVPPEPEEDKEADDMDFDMFGDDAKLVVRDVGSYLVSLAPCLPDLKRTCGLLR